MRGLTQTSPLYNTGISNQDFLIPIPDLPRGGEWTVIRAVLLSIPINPPLGGPQPSPWGVLLVGNWIISLGLCVTDEPCLQTLVSGTEDTATAAPHHVLGPQSLTPPILDFVDEQYALERTATHTLLDDHFGDN